MQPIQKIYCDTGTFETLIDQKANENKVNMADSKNYDQAESVNNIT